MRLAVGQLGRAAARFLSVAVLGAGFSSAFASNVQFVGTVGYSTAYNLAILVINDIHNYDASGASAKLRAELWASPGPFSGSIAGGYRLAAYDIAPLAAGSSTGKITGTTDYSSPPPGTWHIAMVLTEYTGAPTNDGYVVRNYVNFANTLWVPGSTDTTPPTVSITSPTGGSVSGTVTVAASASDNVGVTRVDFYLNGTLAVSDAAAPYQYSWDTTKVANGTATLRAVAYDAAGNTGLSSLVSVTVANGLPTDTTPPTVGIASPIGGNVSGTVAVSATANDNVGVTRVDFYANGVLVASDSAAPWQCAWDTTRVPNGTATLQAKAFDAAGNSGQSAVVTVNIANLVARPPITTPPKVGMTSPAPGSVFGTITLSASASGDAGIVRVEFYADRQLVGSATAAPYQAVWDSRSAHDGPMTLIATAIDAAGNSTSSSVAVTVANHSDNYQGLWWVPAGVESGWGVNLAHQGDQVFATWYTYDVNGRAWWLSMLADRASPGSDTYGGAIYVDRGTPLSSYIGPATPTPVGQGSLSFADGNNGTFAYTVNGVSQSKTITRFDLGTGPRIACGPADVSGLASATNYQGLWWVPARSESGWGVNIAHQGSTMFATWYTYDDNGAPLWLSGLLQRVGSTNAYGGDLLLTSGPRFDSYRQGDLNPTQNVGSATLTFADGNDATFAYTVQLGSGTAVSQSKRLTRFLFTEASGTVCQ